MLMQMIVVGHRLIFNPTGLSLVRTRSGCPSGATSTRLGLDVAIHALKIRPDQQFEAIAYACIEKSDESNKQFHDNPTGTWSAPRVGGVCKTINCCEETALGS